jgi:uncharacterized membrane protein (UPF0127 family)
LDKTIRCSQESARYALEMNQGWFEQHQIELGEPVRGIPGE